MEKHQDVQVASRNMLIFSSNFCCRENVLSLPQMEARITAEIVGEEKLLSK
jgi:hypothetical protein